MTDLRDPLVLPELAQRAQQVTVETGGGVAGTLVVALVVAALLALLAVAPATRATLSRAASDARDRFRRRPPRRLSGARPV